MFAPILLSISCNKLHAFKKKRLTHWFNYREDVLQEQTEFGIAKSRPSRAMLSK